MDFGLLLAHAHQTFVQALHAHLAERGFPAVGSSYGFVLRTLDREAATATRLGERLGITTQGAAKVIDEMVAAGYVERRPDPADKRAKQLRPAPGGVAMLAVVREFHAEYEGRLAQEVGAEDVVVVRRALAAPAATSAGPDPARLFRPL
ncbi:MarR family winged helix-turn-helix transcriptional regulator [Embleya scabrispora]|uniref:MarR family winged helix-turn-helix transcriptional regulator n=1 Tax=Embleya scabrispora TaxID=159449 RepID=UPI0003826EDB|nr:MarR family transcriptional regulator [Embleya scabrispora]MYS84524.1 MarR family transcriptional regulator [Streptomyces sp. SID5474]